MTTPSITRGWHFGTAAHTRRLGRFILSETSYQPDLRTPWHAHETSAFCLVLHGRYVQRYRRRDVLYRASSVIFRPSGAEHADRISPRGASCFIIEPEATWLSEWGLGALHRDYALDQTGPRARWLLEHAREELRHPDGATPLALEGLVLALGAEFARRREPSCSQHCPPWLRRTREALDADLHARATLSQLAADAGVHPVHLAATFRAVFGVSVGEYVRGRRIEAARTALVESDRSINEIAMSLGFSSQSHFTRVFGRATGVTPAAYRRTQRLPRPSFLDS